MNNLDLTMAALKNLRQVGSIVPSSHFLVKKLIKTIDFGEDIHILELGAGDGVITRELLQQMSDESVLYSYENNTSLIELLEQIDDSRLFVKGESVANLHQLADDYFDVVISSLPLANLPKEFKLRMFKDIRSKLKPSGTFFQYQYLPSEYRKLNRYFSNCHLGFCLFNIPPAFIYTIEMADGELVE